MDSAYDLDNPTKTCIVLPRRPRTAGTSKGNAPPPSGPRAAEEDDLRLEAFTLAWNRCLSRMTTIVGELQAPVVSAVTKAIEDAYTDDVLPGLPYVELPVIAVSAPDGGSSVISDVLAGIHDAQQHVRAEVARKGRKKGKQKTAEETNDDTRTPTPMIVASVQPTESTSVMAAMRAIITGFIDRQDDGGLVQLPTAVKRKPTASLANFDINLLKVWYQAVIELNDRPPYLVVVLHDLEKFEPNVLQDVFYICSKSMLPLIFLVDSSAPSTFAYLRSAYSHATIALLRVQVYTAPSGIDLVNEIIEKTFFDPDFEPQIALGPGTLDFLAAFSSRLSTFIDATVSLLQIAYMKHFEEPLVALANNIDRRKVTSALKGSLSLAETLFTRVWAEASSQSYDEREKELPDYLKEFNEEDPTMEGLLHIVESAHAEFRRDAARVRLCYCVLTCVRSFMRRRGYKTSTSTTGEEESDLAFMSRFVRDRVSRDVKHLALMIKKLPSTLLEPLLGELYSLFHGIQSRDLRKQEIDVRVFLVDARESVSKDTDAEREGQREVSEIAAQVSEWFASYIESHTVRLDQKPLGEFWSTGNTPFPSELVNPAARLAVVNALLHPDEIVKAHNELFATGSPGAAVDGEDASVPSALWDLPDTSILFTRYMEAGRMVNVYDLFESFASELDVQREQAVAKEPPSAPQTPKRTKGKGKQSTEVEPGPSEDDDEKWRLEVHARFIRALHELDYMGFVKHTGRKADHIIRTVYDVVD